MSETLTLPSPAKLNRMLHIVGQRSDGYHELQTLFQFLDYGDTLHFTPRADDRITLTPPLEGVDTEHNLIVRAARLLQNACNVTCGVDIRLDKQLPMGGGLGGGSSNAATTLLALDRLWNLGLSNDYLATLGLSLGADVPVFIRGFAAWGESIGERLIPAQLDAPWFVVIHPGIGVATQTVFSHPELTRNSAPISMARAVEGGRNDCERVVRMLQPAIGDALDWLDQFGSAMLTGTGACVFCALTNRAQADSILHRLREEKNEGRYRDWQAFVARGCNTSPLHTALEECRSNMMS
ncbi:4-(cytidine 5'-diphospho)-2-C-methyl-D-erythritol kinase [Phytohalomonas tamaricis]|uniref:4-(cytidine 5'-diphospho)-2-C-methyl-D-erythritol kinase n=1 Tax=Phytohalomonas tamaricis TaxID=2081032 RepID=UPI000D0BC97F|nr:4-(cytidine 5'-diphospho)-2-C-methyl-D-erythritol kinase [Phytohalomonas tamaricis]